MVQALHDFIFILCEVDFDAGLHVKSRDGDPVLLLLTGKKRACPILSDLRKKTVIATAAELQEEDHGNGSVRGGEVRNGLRHPLVEDAEVFFLETGEDVTVLGGGDHIERDDGHVNGNGDPGLWRLLRRAGCCLRRSEEHTSELQSHSDLVCRLLLEKKK